MFMLVCRTDDNCLCDELTSLEPPLLALWLVSELMCDGRGYELNTVQRTFGTFEESKNKTSHLGFAQTERHFIEMTTACYSR